MSKKKSTGGPPDVGQHFAFIVTFSGAHPPACHGPDPAPFSIGVALGGDGSKGRAGKQTVSPAPRAARPLHLGELTPSALRSGRCS